MSHAVEAIGETRDKKADKGGEATSSAATSVPPQSQGHAPTAQGADDSKDSANLSALAQKLS